MLISLDATNLVLFETEAVESISTAYVYSSQGKSL
jgi:hypothetical protein